MPHKRSLEAMQRRAARRAARLHSYNDPILKELAATTKTEKAVEEAIKKTAYNQTGHTFVHNYMLDFCRAGDVLEDTKGRGTLQRMILTARGYSLSDLTPLT